MSDKRVDNLLENFIVIPLIILLGLHVTASLIDLMFQLNNESFKLLFSGVGGLVLHILFSFLRLEKSEI